MDGADAAERQPGLLGQPVGFVQFDRCRQAGRRFDQQPHHGAAEEKEHQRPRGGVGTYAIADLFAVDAAGAAALRSVGGALQRATRRAGGSRLFDAADLVGRKDDLGASAAAVKQALAL